MRVRGHVDLRKVLDCVIMATGSVKTLDAGRCTDEFCNVQSVGCLYRTSLHNPLFPARRAYVERFCTSMSYAADGNSI